MPIKMKTALQISFFFVLGITSGALIRSITNGSDKQSADFASKTPFEMAKTIAPIKVAIDKPESIPLEDQEEVLLKGKISLFQTLQGPIEYSWILPDGIVVREGAVRGALSGLNAGQTAEVHLVVKGFTADTQKVIALSSTSYLGQNQIGNSALVVSRPGDTWEAVAPNMKEDAEAQLGK